jgi:O-antigen ligase
LIDFNAQDEFPLSNFRIRYFGYPITIGEIKMLILIVLVPFILARKNELLPKWSLILLSIPILISLYFTNTRNAMLGLFISLIVIGIVKHRYFLVGFVLAVSLFLYAAPMQVTERILSIADMNYPSNAVRFTMWETGLKMIKDKPVTGFGDVDILNIYTTYKKPELYGEGTHMHNNYMHITVLYGIPGLMIWLALMIYIFFRQIKIYNKVKSDNFLNVLALSSIASMIGFHVSGLTEWNFGDAEFVVVLWFVLSLTFITEKIFTGQKIE